MVNTTVSNAVSDKTRPPNPGASILLEEQIPGGRSLRFGEARRWIVADAPEDVPRAFRQIQQAQTQGLWVAGFLTYELGYVLEPKLSHLLPQDRHLPLLMAGVFDRPAMSSASAMPNGPEDSAAALVNRLEPVLSQAAFENDIQQIKALIAAGDTYQINHTFPMRFRAAETAETIYARVKRNARASHGAFIDLGDQKILSWSPELFLKRTGDKLVSKPMKGTAPRGRDTAEDAELQSWLRSDPKSRAENLMIVDLIRNDLGRVAETGSVRVESQFDVERYPTLHQMTSTVRAKARPEATFEEIIRALFPCGSITGAPKIRSMEIIRDLERAPRGIYTGAIGYIAPNGDFSLSVAIRTALIDLDGNGVLGVGSGIVWDSNPAEEYRETLLKASFLTAPAVPFDLFETLCWSTAEGYRRLSLHLDRLCASAGYFQFSCDRTILEDRLRQEAQSFDGPICRVRLTLKADGTVGVESFPFDPPAVGAKYRVAISPLAVNSEDPFLYHKTSRRRMYDREHARLSQALGADEVLFLNERGELAEGSRTNLFLSQNGRLLTPALRCGVLPGCLRRSLLDDPDVEIEEAVLTLDDLQQADEIFVGNSLRGLVKAELCENAATVKAAASG